MQLTRKKLIIIVVAFIAVTVIMAVVFACDGNSNNSGTGGDTAVPSQNPYTCIVTFDMSGGMINGEKSYKVEVEKNSTIKRPSEIPYLEGCIFWGWNTTGNDGDPMWKFDVENVTGDMTIYAVWIRALKVTFYAEGGVFEDGTDTYTAAVAHGGKVTAPKLTPPEATMEIYSWMTVTGEVWDFSGRPIYDDVYLYAQWGLKSDIQKALAPFMYYKKDDGYHIYGVVDQNVSGTLTVPSVVTSIEFAAFANCPNIVSVVIDDSVTDIEHHAFQNCKSLKSVTLPSGLTSIENFTFDGCSSLEQINLPATVTEVGYDAFKGCAALKSIEIPSGVTEIEGYTFDGCTALERVKLTDNVTKIGGSAFRGCSLLADIQIPSALEELGSSAFEGCSSLKSITISANCLTVGMDAFKACSKLTSAELHCETVDYLAFSDCTALASVMLGAEVRTIRSSAFENCTNLRSVTIGDGVTDIPYMAFSNCYNLRSVIIGSGVKEIESYAFDNCISLLSITIPSNVQSIGSGAFKGCFKLVEVYNLSDASLDGTNVDTNAVVHTDADEESIIHTTDDGFSFCTVKDENVYPYAQTLFLIGYSGDKSNIVLPDNYNGDSYKIYKYALAYNAKLKSVRLSAGVTDIKLEILYKSDNVTSLTVDSGNTVFSSSGNCVINTADKKFILGCKTSVIPDDGSVTTIGEYVFCENAPIAGQAFKIPDAVTRVDRYAFYGCSDITRIVDNIVYVDKWAISLGNYDLNSGEMLDLEFQSGTIGIAEYAFWKRNCVQSVTFNDEMKYVGNSAFFDCKELTTANFNDGLLIINGSAFYDCEKLQEAVLPDTVTTLGWGVFYGCTALTYAKLPAAFTKSNTQIFYNCNALNAIVIPLSIKEIGYSVFLNCPDTVNVYFCGSEQQWNAVTVRSGNTAITNGTKYFYSETEIEGVNCWHYGADGKPTTEYN